MSARHDLAICADFLEPGFWAECCCGWRSRIFIIQADADAAGRRHLTPHEEGEQP